MAGGKITLREAQTIAYLLEHGRLPDPETAAWFERRASRAALNFLLTARLRGTAPAQPDANGRGRRNGAPRGGDGRYSAAEAAEAAVAGAASGT